VGFRFTSQRLAHGFAVAGFVRNLDDGRVELVAEGEPTELDALLDAVRREFGGRIRDERVESEPRGGPPLSGFSIRY
jgi:acylphosphatase